MLSFLYLILLKSYIFRVMRRYGIFSLLPILGWEYGMQTAFDPAVEAAKLNALLHKVNVEPCLSFSSFTRRLNHQVVTRLAITVRGQTAPGYLLRPAEGGWEFYHIGGCGKWGSFSSKALECLVENAGRRPSDAALEWGYHPQRHFTIALRAASSERLI
jgi:hypothetical protein